MLTDFVRGYLDCALWLETDDSDNALRDNYSFSDFSQESLAKAAADCDAFELANASDLAAFYEVHPMSPDGDTGKAFAGHNFWLTRNEHGTGFWDRGAGEAGDRLSKASRQAGECYVYVGDDGQLWIS